MVESVYRMMLFAYAREFRENMARRCHRPFVKSGKSDADRTDSKSFYDFVG